MFALATLAANGKTRVQESKGEQGHGHRQVREATLPSVLSATVVGGIEADKCACGVVVARCEWHSP